MRRGGDVDVEAVSGQDVVAFESDLAVAVAERIEYDVHVES